MQHTQDIVTRNWRAGGARLQLHNAAAQVEHGDGVLADALPDVLARVGLDVINVWVEVLIAAADVCVAGAERPLAANLPVVRELAREDVDALLFAPGDSDDLARQLGRALAERLAGAAAERAQAQFTWRRLQKRLLKVYEQFGKVPDAN